MPVHVVNIEDDRSLRDILRFAFQAVDPRINLHQFGNGDEALPYIEQHARDIDLFLVDMRLPGTMNGIQIAQKIREQNCAGRVILTSAFALPDLVLLKSLDLEYFPKPWHIMELAQKLVQQRITISQPTARLFVAK